ncbi:MAG: tyrosine-protein phosphatase [Candidatus Nanopelagicales bacterium]
MSDHRLNIPGTLNFRDTDSYAAAGGVTRAGQLYRSDSLHNVPPEGISQIAGLGIEVIVDLRSPTEVRNAGGAVQVPGAQVVSVPIYGGSRSSVAEDEEVTLERMYRMTLQDYATGLAEAVTVIAATGSAPTLVCCTAGKDRTGLVVALSLFLAGVEQRGIVADYVQSALNLDGPWLTEAATDLVSRGVPLSPRLFAVLGGSPANALIGVLAWLAATHGSVEKYLIGSGMPETAPAALRAKLIKPVGR